MPRSHTILQSEFPYHVGARSINRDWFRIPIDHVWKIMTDQLMYISYVYNAKIHSFVLMNNHFHMILSTPDANLDLIMWNFMKETSRMLTFAGNRVNQTYGGPYFRSVIKGSHYFEHAYKYVYSNPVQANIVNRVETYPYSTLHGLLGLKKLEIPLLEDTILFNNVEKTLEWLNRKPHAEDWKSIREALHKKEFQIAKNCLTKKHSRLEFDAL